MLGSWDLGILGHWDIWDIGILVGLWDYWAIGIFGAVQKWREKQKTLQNKCMSISMFVYVHMYIYLFACKHVYLHICTHMFIYIHTYIHMHIHIYMYITIYTLQDYSGLQQLFPATRSPASPPRSHCKMTPAVFGASPLFGL